MPLWLAFFSIPTTQHRTTDPKRAVVLLNHNVKLIAVILAAEQRFLILVLAHQLRAEEVGRE